MPHHVEHDSEGLPIPNRIKAKPVKRPGQIVAAIIVVIFAATLVTAASVAVTGMIGWVGLVIPHFARMVIGCDYRKLLPASMLMGASFLLIVDDVARLATTSEIPIGILTAFVGAPFFLYLITRKKQL